MKDLSHTLCFSFVVQVKVRLCTRDFRCCIVVLFLNISKASRKQVERDVTRDEKEMFSLRDHDLVIKPTPIYRHIPINNHFKHQQITTSKCSKVSSFMSKDTNKITKKKKKIKTKYTIRMHRRGLIESNALAIIHINIPISFYLVDA